MNSSGLSIESPTALIIIQLNSSLGQMEICWFQQSLELCAFVVWPAVMISPHYHQTDDCLTNLQRWQTATQSVVYDGRCPLSGAQRAEHGNGRLTRSCRNLPQ